MIDLTKTIEINKEELTTIVRTIAIIQNEINNVLPLLTKLANRIEISKSE